MARLGRFHQVCRMNESVQAPEFRARFLPLDLDGKIEILTIAECRQRLGANDSLDDLELDRAIKELELAKRRG